MRNFVKRAGLIGVSALGVSLLAIGSVSAGIVGGGRLIRGMGAFYLSHIGIGF